MPLQLIILQNFSTRFFLGKQNLSEVALTTATLATSVYWIATLQSHHNSTIWKPKARRWQSQLGKVMLMISANHITLG